MKYTDLKARFDNPRNVYEKMMRGFAPRLVAGFRQFPVISCNGQAVVDTSQFKARCEALKDGEIFVIGRAADSDYYLPNAFVNDASGRRPAKTSVSRYHCYIQKGRNGEFELYDTSATYTKVCL